MKTALELFNHRYSEDEKFSWLEMIDFAEAYASQSKEECANYARSKAVTDKDIEDAFPRRYLEELGSAHNTLQLARRSGAKWMREQQGEGAKGRYIESCKMIPEDYEEEEFAVIHIDYLHKILMKAAGLTDKQ